MIRGAFVRAEMNESISAIPVYGLWTNEATRLNSFLRLPRSRRDNCQDVMR